MLFELVTGGAGSGKSACIENRIEDCIKEGKKALVIVPERFSHIEERTLCAHFGGLGLNGIEVSTFSKLSRRLASAGEYLFPSGREMLVLKAAKENSDAGDGIFDLAYERGGFVEQMSSAITELKRNLITPDMIEGLELDGFLGRKMSAIGAIYKSYNEMIENGFSDPDDNISRLADIIETEGGFADTCIFIDGFSDFMPAHYKVIGALIKRAESVLVTLTINDDGLLDTDGIFAPVAYSMDMLERVAGDLGVVCQKTHLKGEYSYIKSDDLKFFLSNYDSYKPIQKAPECKNIVFDICKDRHDEVEKLAGRIMNEVRENNLRFRDIGVIVGNGDAYSHIIEAVFSEYGIPYYSDNKRSATDHAVIRTVLSVFKIINENWSFNSVFEYLRSGFVYKKTKFGVERIDNHGVDKLELYCRTRGIRGKKVWLSEESWKASKKGVFDEATDSRAREEKIDDLDSLRRELMLPFAKLTENISGRRRAKELAAALFEFLDDIALYEGLAMEQEKLEEANSLDDAARISAVWDTILETLDQIVLTSGDEYISREDFARMLEVGFSKGAIDTVPPGIDCVAVGSASMSRPVRVKALFVLGAVRGELPPEMTDTGIITEADRALLSANGYDILRVKQTGMQLAEFNLFSSLTAACQRLYISYPSVNDEGAKTTPAPIVTEVERCFGDVSVKYDTEAEWNNILSSGKSTYNKLISRISADISEQERKFWDEMWEYVSLEEKRPNHCSVKASDGDCDFSIFESVENKREDILTALESYKQGRTHIRESTAQKLYGDRKLSITALEKYNKCPFAYFANYGLGLGEESEYRVGGSDIGKMVHWALYEYCQKVQESAKSEEEKKNCWIALTKEQSDNIIGEIVVEIEKKSIEANPEFCEERLALMCKKVSNTLKRSAVVVRESLVSGGFSAVSFEQKFDFTLEKNGQTVDVYGIIDRLDTADDENGKLLRVIDYKTGKQEFSVTGIYNRTDLQLVMYALAAENMYKNDNARIAALMYDKVKDELVKTEFGSPAAIMAAPLDGVIVTETDSSVDEDILIHDITLAQKDAKSSFLPLSTKKAGGLKKSPTVISRDKFNMLARYVTKAAIETKNQVLGGYIAPKPTVSSDRTACAWCEYSALCLHNDERDGTRVQLTAKGKAWEQIEMEDENE